MTTIVSSAAVNMKERYTLFPIQNRPIFSLYEDQVKAVWTPYEIDFSEDLKDLKKMKKEERKERGLKGREWAIKNLSSKVMCDAMVEGIETTIKNYKPKQRYNLYKIV